MSALEINKILASIIVALLLLGFIGHIGNLIVKVEPLENQETAYKIAIPESKTNVSNIASVGEKILEPVSSLLINASFEKGEKIFKKCGTCHNYTKNSASKIGPSLWNIVNSLKGNVSNFAYSKALKEFGGKWTYEELSNFLYKPKNYIIGTKMNFAGLNNVEDRANLIFWLRQNSDNPVPLPK